jgi:hypothetical protein
MLFGLIEADNLPEFGRGASAISLGASAISLKA